MARHSCTFLFVHVVWKAWDGLPLLVAERESMICRILWKECERLRCEPVAIGGTSDHVHLLVRLHASVSVASLVKQAKGASSRYASQAETSDQPFRWQRGYGAFTIHANQVPTVKAYVEGQKEHHAAGTFRADWEEVGEEDGE